ncbi:MAG: FMN-binding protein [Oscillospiraceae bacterium]|jgi:electron transport complex protein RnfG|nr:FMN-binding protein [Oscillospiraceae bacterium]
MMKDFVAPVAALTVICLVISGALAVTNSITSPVIAAASRERALVAQKEVLQEADVFEPLDVGGVPAAVTEAYRAANGAGYVFMLLTSGYGGDISMIIGIDSAGAITAVKTLSHSETEGMGAKITEPDFESQFPGQANLDGVQAISGATISSRAYLAAVGAAFEAYEILNGEAA